MKKYIYIVIIVFILFYAGINFYEKSHSQKSIYVVSMTADEMSTGLKNGTIAGFISWEPYPAVAVIDRYGRYLVHSEEIWPDHMGCVMAVSEYLQDENMIKALVWVHIKSTRFLNDPANHEKVVRYGSEFTGVDRDAVSLALRNTIYIEFPDIPEIKKGYEILDKAGAFKKSPASMGYRNLDDFMSDVIIDKYYNEIKKRLDEDPDWVPPPVNGSIRFGFIDGNLHYLGVYVGEKEGYFERIGLVPDKNLQFVRFRNGMAITNAFNHREVDVATFGAAPLLRYRINDNGKIYIINGINYGGTSLVVRADSDIKSIDDLSGSTIATPGFGSIQDVIMRKMFEGFEIKTV